MDRVELGIKLDQINKLREKSEYADAAKVCDTIDWRRVKKWSELSVAQEVYEKAGRMKDSRNICVYAYNRSLGGKRLLFKLTELSIAINDLEEADDLYKEFVETAPRDMERYILLYKLNKARGAGNNKLIDILEEYKQNELDEQYEYELAELYANAGRIDDCIRECDDLILWFNEGEYVEKALRLKAKHAELTKAQMAKLKTMEEFRAAGFEYESVLPAYESEPDIPEPPAVQSRPSAEYTGSGKIYDEEYRIPEKDYSIYDTQNVQAELAKNMAAILEGIKRADYAERNIQETQEERTQAADERFVQTEPVDMEDYYGRTAEIYSSPQEFYGVAQEPELYDAEPEEIPEAPLPDETQAFVESLDSEASCEPEPTGTDNPYRPDMPYDGFDDMPVDEPTKEIRINTHHWKRYKSYMVEDESPEASNPPSEENVGALPRYLVEKSESEAESVTGPEFIIEDLETVVEVGIDDEAVTEALEAKEPTSEETDSYDASEEAAEEMPVAKEAPEESAPNEATEEKTVPEEVAEESAAEEVLPEEAAEEPVEEEIPSEELSAEPTEEENTAQESAVQPAEKETEQEPVPQSAAQEQAQEPASVSVTAADNAEDSEIIDGQIDLLAWLSSDSQSSETVETTEETETNPEAESAAETKSEAEFKTESEAEPETKPETESEPEPIAEEAETEAEPQQEEILPEIEEPESETEEDKSVEEVMDEMTRMLMAEVTQDIEEREKQKKPTGISEEEYIATSEAESEDKSDEGEAEKQAAAAAAESAVTDEPDTEDEVSEAENEIKTDICYDEGNDFVLKEAERKYLRQYLFMDGFEAQAAQIINSKKREIPDGTSSKGNIVILGKAKTNKKNFAIDLFKAMHAHDGAGSLKIARTAAAIINRNGINSVADKIKGMTLIVEHADQLTRKSVGELCEFMKGDTESMLVMLTGEDYAVKRLFTENPDFAEMFDYTVHIRQYTVNEFVAMAKEYSRIKGYLITDRALLKLYLMIDGLVANDDGAQVDGVRRIVDNAIERSRKKPKKSGALIRLKEKDFVE
ncbi:MAG: hypothetical protein HDT13_12070 [Butyrivibrio sp.]|nr:hypothetical protein [Butyrivibrio sp.]